MSRITHWATCLVVLMLSCRTVQAQEKLSIRAASGEAIDGWQKMQVGNSNRMIWVSPTTAITENDIAEAHPEVRSAGDTVIAVEFTDAGTHKLHDLTAAQLKKLIALIVDDKVIWAPAVQYVTEGKDNVLTGDGPHGLTQAHVERIMAILRK